MSTIDGGHLVAKALKLEGVSCAFTLCGGHIAPIYEGCLKEGIDLIDTRHEQAAGHAADAWARLTRGVGVALVTAGPGVTDVVTAVANAYYAQSPLLVIGGKSPNFLSDMGSLQEMEQVELMRPITKWSRVVTETRRIPELLSMAFRIALSGVPGPVFLEIAVDALMNQIEESHVDWPSKYRTSARPYGDPVYVEKALELLGGAERPVVIAGSSIWWDDAAAELRRFSETAGVPVFLNGMGRGCLPPEHPNFYSLSRKTALQKGDVVFVVGTPLDFRLGYGRGPTFGSQTRVVQVDRDPALIGKNRPIEVGIVGDSRAVLGALSDGLGARRRDFSDWRGELRRSETERRRKQEESELSTAKPINHYRFAREIADFIGEEEVILIGDGGDIVAVCARVIPQRAPGRWLDPGPLGTLGIGAPFALAAKKLHPDKKVLILYGDGSFGLNGFDMETAVRFGLPVVAIVGNDAAWGQIRGPQVAFYGEERAVATGLAPVRYDRVVEAFGGYGEHVENPGQIGPALRRAFDSGKPACINVPIDPTTLRAEAMAKGLTI
jgi:acetolactate synthase-1/2/3 large subunit